MAEWFITAACFHASVCKLLMTYYMYRSQFRCRHSAARKVPTFYQRRDPHFLDLLCSALPSPNGSGHNQEITSPVATAVGHSFPTCSITVPTQRKSQVKCATSLRAEALTLGVSVDTDMIPIGPREDHISSFVCCASLRNLACLFVFPSIAIASFYSCYSTIPLFPFLPSFCLLRHQGLSSIRLNRLRRISLPLFTPCLRDDATSPSTQPPLRTSFWLPHAYSSIVRFFW